MEQHFDSADQRHGSASWAQGKDLRRADVIGRDGLPIGYFDGKLLRLDGDAPMLTIGGAGSGKLRDLLGYVVCTSTDQRMFVLDPRGELYAISWHNFIRSKAYVYCWNPTGLHDNPQHRINPLDILKWDSPTFQSDTKFIAESLIPFSGGSSSKYFEQRARQWVEAILKSQVERNGQVDFPTLHRIINMIESDRSGWTDQLQRMLGSSMPDVVRTVGEVLTKQTEAQREFSAIMGTIYAGLGFLDDPTLLRSLENPDVSLEGLATSERPVSVFLNVPIEFVSLWAPVLRVMFTVTMLYKARRPQGPRVTMITDEAGQLGNFEALLRSFTFGRGAGVRSWAIFQDIGQIARNFGREAVQSFMGSAQMRQFFGVRDYQTAQLISSMLGQETLRYDEPLRAADAQMRKKRAAYGFMNGNDPFVSMFDYAHANFVSDQQSKAPRALMSPDEILALPEDQQILFISGKNLKPVLANKFPYFQRREMAGRYLPNPYHPPIDRVPVAGRLFRKTMPVVCEPIPPELVTYPQYHNGTARFVKGRRPY